MREPVWVAECVCNEVLVECFRILLGDIYDVETVNLCPTNFGHPQYRERMWAVGRDRSAVMKTASLTGLLDVFSKDVVADAHMYFTAPEEMVSACLAAEAQRRYKLAPEGSTVTWEVRIATSSAWPCGRIVVKR